MATPYRHSPRELAYAGLFGAAALLMPVLFHMIHLGRVLMPMYLPLVTLAFLVRPLPAVLTAAMTPLLSAAVTGMPPFYPPVAVFMAIELASMAGVISTVLAKRPGTNTRLLLAGTLLMGRAMYCGLVYGFALVIHLPPALTAGVSLLSGWPGIVLMLVAVPPVVRIVRQSSARQTALSKEDHP
jgi:hypothetical protein